MRRALGLAVLAGPLLWRRRASRAERAEIAFDDGSAVVLEDGPAARSLLAIARRAL